MSTGQARLPGTNLNRSSLGQPDARARAFTARVSDDFLGQIFDCFPDEMKQQPRWGGTRRKVTCFEFGTGRRRSSPGHRNSPCIRTGDLPINANSFTCQDVHSRGCAGAGRALGLPRRYWVVGAEGSAGAKRGWACIGLALDDSKHSRRGWKGLRGSGLEGPCGAWS